MRNRFAWPIGLAAVALSLALLGCGGEDSDSDLLPTGPIIAKAMHYDLAFDLSSRAATASVTLRVEEPGDCVTLPLAAEPMATYIDGQAPVSAEIKNGELTACGSGWNAGSEIVLEVQTILEQNQSDGEQLGYTVSTDVAGAPYHSLISWIGGCSRFGPCDAAPGSFATYHFAVDHPPGMQLLCPGKLTQGTTHSECAFDSAGGPTYSTYGLALSPSWTEHSLGKAQTVSLKLYDMAPVHFIDEFSPEILGGFVTWMTEQFGDYPYGDELRLIVGPTYWNGFEHPGNITLNHDLATPILRPAYADRLHHTAIHEIAHQWAGDQTTIADTYDFVWKEAMAEYLSFVYEDEALDPSIALQTSKAWKGFSQGARYFPVPQDRPTLIDYYGDVYGPGPLILFRQIEAMYGREAVLAALKQVLGTERSLSVDEVIAALEEATGADLTNYTARWLRGEGAPSWPIFDVEVSAQKNGTKVTVTQQKPEQGLFGCAFAVRLEGADQQSVEANFNLGPDGMPSASMDVKAPFEITKISFDPHATCLATMANPGAQLPVQRQNPWVAAGSNR